MCMEKFIHKYRGGGMRSKYSQKNHNWVRTKEVQKYHLLWTHTRYVIPLLSKVNRYSANSFMKVCLKSAFSHKLTIIGLAIRINNYWIGRFGPLVDYKIAIE
jgi:hypothetical protein